MFEWNILYEFGPFLSNYSFLKNMYILFIINTLIIIVKISTNYLISLEHGYV